MLLRASGEKEATSYDLAAVTRTDADSGVDHGELLIQLAEQTAGSAWQALRTTFARAIDIMGERQVVDALVVASAFNGITRVADATGIPLDENTAATTSTMRAATGLDAFAYDAKTKRYG